METRSFFFILFIYLNYLFWFSDSADLDKTRSAVDDISVNPSRIYERQELGCAVVWILKNLEESWFGKWRLANPSVVFSGLLPLLEDLLQVFCREKVKSVHFFFFFFFFFFFVIYFCSRV